MTRPFALAVHLALLALAPRVAADPSELPPQFAYDYGETETARSAGVGAMHALGGSITALYANPANLGSSRSYHMGVIGQFLPEAKRHLYGAAVMDSTRRISGGFSFVGGFQDPDGIARQIVDVRAALAFAASKAIHLGVSGRYLSIDQDGTGPLGKSSRASGGLVDDGSLARPDEPIGRQRMLSTVTFDAGVAVRPVEELCLAAFGHNLSYPNHGLLPTLVGGGIGYGTLDFSLEVDALVDLNSYGKPSPRIMAGAEYLLLHHVPLRAGYRFDRLDGSGETMSHAISGGVGYVEPRFGVEASLRRTLVGPSATFVFLGVSYYLDSLGLQVQP